MAAADAGPVPGWLGEAAFGSIVLLALFGWVWFKPAVQQLIDRAARAEGQRDEMLGVYQQDVIPALREQLTLGVKMVELVEKQATVLTRVEMMLAQQRGP